MLENIRDVFLLFVYVLTYRKPKGRAMYRNGDRMMPISGK